MAVDVNTVYRTVLLILNKEQRGYMTPDEFNKVAAQVQLEIFNGYFDDLNQLLRTKQPDLNYADRISLLDDKLSIFKSSMGLFAYNGLINVPPDVREIGSVVYDNNDYVYIEIQRLQKSEFYNINKSDLTKPSENYPVYLYENNTIKVYPQQIGSVEINFIRQITNPVWDFQALPSTNYRYDYNPATSTQFELHASEQTNIITRILMYSGVIIKSPDIVQLAAQQVQEEQINSKS